MHSLRMTIPVANEPIEKEKKRKDQTTPFGVSSMRSPVLYRVAQIDTGTVCTV